MTPEEGLDFFRGLSPSTIKLGLDRMARALEELGHPERRFPRTLHVAGTNGKGSTCAFAESVLQTAGLRTGLYTSPHLIRMNERFRVNGLEISDETLGKRVLEILARSKTARTELTYFEFGTLMAFWHFTEEKVDVAVLETGLGGRLDATNLCVPTVTAITALGLDHTELLGDTLEKIAFEKAGIFKRGVPAIVAPQANEPMAVLAARAKEVEAPLIRVDVDAARSLELGLRGPHQRENAAVALAALERLGLSLRDDAVKEGLRQARWPGRLEEIHRDPTVLVDGAHNPHGVEALLTALDRLYPRRPVHLVFGVFADKDYVPMIEALFPRAKAIYLAALQNPRSLPPKRYEARAQALSASVQSYATVAEALEAACQAVNTAEEMVLVAGSLVLVGEAEAWAQQRGRT